MISYADLSIVIPVYNEGQNIHSVLKSMTELFGKQPEILICYDFDEDNTLPEARQYLHLLNIRFLKNTGKGVLGAIKTGFQNASHAAVLVTMADLSDDLATVPLMLEKFERGAVVVCASRYMPGGQQIGGAWFKSMLSKMAGLSLNFLTGIQTHDITSNFRLYSKAFLESIHIESRGGFELALELTVKAFAKKLEIAEVPTTWRDRTAGESRFRLIQWLPQYLRWYWFAICARFCGQHCNN